MGRVLWGGWGGEGGCVVAREEIVRGEGSEEVGGGGWGGGRE